MRLSLVMQWGNAAWRESARVGASEIDVDHLYLGLIALGGASARLLGRHGVSLTSARARVREQEADAVRTLGLDPTPLQVRPRTLKELSHHPDVAWTPPARALFDKLSHAPDTFALLVGLLRDSEAVRKLLAADGVLPNDLVAELREGSDDPLGAERVPTQPGLLPAPARALRVSRFISVAPDHLAGQLADPASLPWWAYDADHAEADAGGERVRMTRGRRTMTVRFHVTRHDSGDSHTVAWLQEMLDGEYAGQPLRHDRFDIAPAPGGCDLTRTNEHRLFKLSGRLLAPVIERLTALGALHSLQSIAYGATQ